MADARVVPEQPLPPAHLTIRREDYRPPDWLVPQVELDFTLDPDSTRVRSKLTVTRNGTHDRPLCLDGDELTPLKVSVDGAEARWSMDGPALVIELSGDTATVETEVEIDPTANTKLTGLYASGGGLYTQCEAEGFRRITFFPDRPDVLARYTVTLTAPRTLYPVLHKLETEGLVASRWRMSEVGRQRKYYRLTFVVVVVVTVTDVARCTIAQNTASTVTSTTSPVA